MKYSIIAIAILLLSGCSSIQRNEQYQFDALNQALVDLSNAQTIEIWNPKCQEWENPISNKDINHSLVEWIRTQPLEFDHEKTDSLARGTVCGCLPVIISITEEKRIYIHHHHLIIFPEKIAYSSSVNNFEIDEVLILAAIMNPPVLVELSHSSAIVILDAWENMQIERLSDSATDIAFREFHDNVYDQITWPTNDAGWESLIPDTKKKILQGW